MKKKLALMFSVFAVVAADFPKIDANGDGQLNLDELIAAGVNWDKEQFAAADGDGSGTLSKEELEKAAN